MEVRKAIKFDFLIDYQHTLSLPAAGCSRIPIMLIIMLLLIVIL